MESSPLNYSDAYYRPHEEEYPEKRPKIKYFPSRDTSGRIFWKELPAKRRHKYDLEASSANDDAYTYPLYPPMHSGDDLIYENYPTLPIPYKPCIQQPQEFISYVYPCPDLCIDTLPNLPYAGDVQKYHIRKVPKLRRRRHRQYASEDDASHHPQLTYPEYVEIGVETTKPDVKSVSCGNFKELKETSSQSDEIKISCRSVECFTEVIEEEVVVLNEDGENDSVEVKEVIEVVLTNEIPEKGSVCVVEEPQEENVKEKRENTNVVFEEVSSDSWVEEFEEEVEEEEEEVVNLQKCPVKRDVTQRSFISSIAEFLAKYLLCMLKVFPRLSLKQLLIRIFFP